MASLVTCLSCKNSFPASGASADEPQQCPNCGALVATSGSLARQGAPTHENAPKGARPQLLDRLPPSPVASPGVVAGGIAFVMAYGAVMLVVLSGPRDEPDTFEDPDPYLIAARTRATPAPAPPPPPAPKPKPKPGETTPKVEDPEKKAEASPEPPPDPLIAKANTSKSKSKPKPKPKPKPIRTIANLGKLVDPAGDSRLSTDATGLTIALPGKLHVLSPELNLKNSPMALIEVEGDFVAQVKVAGEVMPGRTPVDMPDKKPVEKMPFAFHGAGLLLWKDKDNYVRLERAGAGASGRPHVHQILVEVCKDGKPAGHNYADWPPGPTHLRMERRKDALICSHSGDGQTWVEDKVLGNLFPGKVKVGVSASSTSKKAFPARFEEFTLAERPAETAEPATP